MAGNGNCQSYKKKSWYKFVCHKNRTGQKTYP